MVDVLVLQDLYKGGKFDYFLGCDLSIVFHCMHFTVVKLGGCLWDLFGFGFQHVLEMYICTLSNLFRA